MRNVPVISRFLGIIPKCLSVIPAKAGISCFLIIFLFNSAFALIKETGSDGITVELSKPAHRVVSLAPNITETLFYIGGGKYTIARDEASDYPAAAKALPVVAGVRSANVEAILKRKPDLVIAWQDGTTPDAINALNKAGVPVFVVDPKSLIDVIRMIRQVGHLTGLVANARTRAMVLAKDYRDMLRVHILKKKIRVFIQVGFPPLYTAGSSSIQSEIISLCGGKNIFSDIKQAAAPVALTEVIKRAPDAIVAMRHANFIVYKHFPALPAVKKKALFVVNSDEFARAGPRIFKAALQVCRDLDQVKR